jgi:hypothetical protein
MGDAIVEMQQLPKAPMTDEQDGKIKTSEKKRLPCLSTEPITMGYKPKWAALKVSYRPCNQKCGTVQGVRHNIKNSGLLCENPEGKGCEHDVLPELRYFC